MKLGYYPGCSLHNSAAIYDRSLKWVLSRLGISLAELPEWVCCGATSAHSLESHSAFLLPAANLLQAQKMRADLLVACSACYQRLKIAQDRLENSAQARSEFKAVLGEEYIGQFKILSLLEVLSDNLDKLGRLVSREMKGVKVIPYYGCLLSRIPGVGGMQKPLAPNIMERLLELSGAELLPFPRKHDCCGASFGLSEERLYRKLSGDILDEAKKAGADCLVACCPFCQLNLEMLGWKRKQQDKTYRPLPVLFITQWLGLALGAESKAMGLSSLLVEPVPALCEN